jgi:chromosome segregation ATPase
MTDYSYLKTKLFDKAREDCPESKAVYQHICWEAANLIGDLEQRVADLEHELGKVESQFFTCNQLYDEQAKRIAELEAQNEKWGKVGLHYQAEWNMALVRIEELEHQLKVECDTYLWKRKLMSRRIAFLQGWMKKLFKYGSSPEARRNQMTMTTEIPDTLMREGEDLLLETSASGEG